MAVTAKLGNVGIYDKAPSSIKSFDALTTWSSDHVPDKKTWAYYLQSHINCCSLGHIKSYNKWKSL